MAGRVHPAALGYDGRMLRLARVGIVCFLVSACGGASDQDVLSASSSTSSGGAGASSTSSSGGTSTSSSGGSTGNDGGSTNPPAGSCPQENEPNDDQGSANKLVTSICGVLAPASETDFLTFELPPGTKTMNLTFEGNIKMRITVDGKDAVEISPASNPRIPFVVGRPYLVEIRAFSGGDKIAWRVNLNRT